MRPSVRGRGLLQCAVVARAGVLELRVAPLPRQESGELAMEAKAR